jgi:hypothetical protein
MNLKSSDREEATFSQSPEFIAITKSSAISRILIARSSLDF